MTTHTEENTFYHAHGRRKTATCRVRLYLGNAKVAVPHKTDEFLKKGDIIVNNLPITEYFSGAVAKKLYDEPFRTTNTMNRFIITVRCSGGGQMAQLDAFVHAISRALSKIDPEKYHTILARRGFLTRDDRAKERKKPGLMGARKRKSSPKR